MRWGLVARPELDRGIGIQTREMYLNLNPDFTLMVHMERTKGSTWTPGGDFAAVTPLGDHKLPMADVERILRGAEIDALVTVETFYDPEVVNVCRALGIRTFNQMNPEFYRAHWPQPDRWWWPTSWRTNRLPQGTVMPVPVSWTVEAPEETDGLLHVIGKPAIYDRAGTYILFEALELARERHAVRIHAQLGGDKWRPHVSRTRGKHTVRVAEENHRDRRKPYQGAAAVIMPRRYGGLSLPVLEAFGSGLAVIMPDAPPNNGWPISSVEWSWGQEVILPCGPVRMVDTNAKSLAAQLDEFARRPDKLMEARQRGLAWAKENTWERLKHLYIEDLERVVGRA